MGDEPDLHTGLARLAEAQQRTEERVGALATQMESMAGQLSDLTGHVNDLRGDALERKYRERGHAQLGRVARRLRTVPADQLEDLLDQAQTAGMLDTEAADEIRRADAVYRCRIEGEPGFLVLEVSWGVGVGDVARARERADLLARTGAPTVAVVAGTWISFDASRAADALGVWRVTNGRAVPPGGSDQAAS